jgi:hypothetical protein
MKNSLQERELQLRESLIHTVTHKFCEKPGKPHTTKHFTEVAEEFA